jgi:tRNA threonylcarbamoyl adenosine modification protein YeaZ
MLCALIDTSGQNMLLGLAEETGRLAAAAAPPHTKENSAAIAELFARMLADAGVWPDELTHLGIGCGPGSFIGTRTGLAFANGYAAGRNLPVIALNSLRSAGVIALTMAEGSAIFRAARKRSYYAGLYRADTLEAGREMELADEVAFAMLESGFTGLPEVPVQVVTDCRRLYDRAQETKLPPRYSVVLKDNVADLRGLAILAGRALRAGTTAPWADAVYLRPAVD